MSMNERRAGGRVAVVAMLPTSKTNIRPTLPRRVGEENAARRDGRNKTHSEVGNLNTEEAKKGKSRSR